ncbi:conjugative transposon protein TraN [Flavobacterium supellecticarium]|uniref:Conjugative transposon protein TraN n=1 Tax=Flavobacterium supellecticarium TaxID=2565924 RepID=A0A4V3W8X5_9FLAO|nr:conjugative transposon protein TraN [Flavobacterium supellecticarium]THF52966.1 conjugative transposon protein TraN [Flavobacterium supellecticarium]
MKKRSAEMIMGLILFISGVVGAFAQNGMSLKTNEAVPHRIEVGYFKTSNIVFPHAIVSVDRGSKDLLVQKAAGVENILQVKAGKEGFSETNLSVVLADGKLCSFIVAYAKDPNVLNFSLMSTSKSNTVYLTPESINESEVKKYADYALYTKHGRSGVKSESNSIMLDLNGIFIHQDIMYFKAKIENRSNIGYDIDQFRLFIRDQKKAKRTASQEVEIEPVYVHNQVDKIKARSIQIMIFAVPKFTIPDKKYLNIQLMEKNGGRHLELAVKNKSIINAIPLK